MVAVQALDAKTAGSGGSKEPLGRVVINLSDFASEDGRATQAFTVACSRSISAAVGEAKLLVTIGCTSLFCMFCTFNTHVLQRGHTWVLREHR